MEFITGDPAGRGIEGTGVASPLTASSSTPERLESLLEALSPPGSVSLLIGDAGTGKSRLGIEAANALSKHLGEEISVISLSPPANPIAGVATHFGYHFPEILNDIEAPEHAGTIVKLGPEEFSARLFEIVEEQSEFGTPLLIAPGLDEYSPVAATMLEKLVRSKKCRVVATAQRVSGAVAHLARNPRVRKISVPPLNFVEAKRYLVQLLAVEHIELQTLRRWYQMTAGNSLSLSLIALALDRRGLLGRQRGVAYELPGAEMVPVEFHEFLHSTCSPEELRTLEVIAHVEPILENTFITLLDPAHIAKLRDRGLLYLENGTSAQAALRLQHPLLASAIREHTAHERVVEISAMCFDALQAELNESEPGRSTRVLLRLVEMGLEAHREVPFAWLWDTLGELRSGPDFKLRLRVALAIAEHPDATALQLATAAQQANYLARMIGDQAGLRVALVHVRRAVEHITGENTAGLGTQWVRLQCALIDHLVLELSDERAALARLAELEDWGADRAHGPGADHDREIIRTARVILLARLGRLREAGELAPGTQEFGTMPVEWERGGSRAVLSLVLTQRGEFEEAIRLAEYAESFVSVGERPQPETKQLLRFCSFIGFWACGSLESAREELRATLHESYDDDSYSGLIDTCLVLMSLADGKWRLAAQRAERLAARLVKFDRYGLGSFVQAALALALGALGERAASRRAIRNSQSRKLGISQMLAGTMRVLMLRARQWNGDSDTAQECLSLAEWARAENLPAVELQALHLFAIETGERAAAQRERIVELAEFVEPPFSPAVWEHCEELLAGEVAWDSPPARALTEFGIWMPLPQTDELSAREREIALYATLGYSSRWIADQFHLSVRTVDTHLRHVFTKLGVSGRDELRQWFRREEGELSGSF